MWEAKSEAEACAKREGSRQARERGMAGLVRRGILPEAVAGALASEGASVVCDERNGRLLVFSLYAETGGGLEVQLRLDLMDSELAPKDWEDAIGRAAEEFDPFCQTRARLDDDGRLLPETSKFDGGFDLYQELCEFKELKLAEIASAADYACAGAAA